jgi:excisionase family DNA binding protein
MGGEVNIRTDSLGLSVPQAARLAGIGVSTAYEKIQGGELPARKCGRRTIILRRDLEKFLEALPPKTEPSAAHRSYVRRRWDATKNNAGTGGK